ncbi:MAG: PrsW family glutamic-type intramembrane protease [Anaerolineaceae bacterium]
MMIVEGRKNDWLKISQFIFSLIAFLITTISAASCFAGGLLFRTTFGFSIDEAGLLLSLGSVCVLLAVIHFSALVQAAKEPSLPEPTVNIKIDSFILASIALLCWAIVLILTYFHIGEQFFSSLQAYLTPLEIWIPIWWFVEFGKRNLPRITARKRSAALSLGSSYTVFFIMFLELIFISLIFAGVLIYLNAQPQIQQWLKTITVPQDLFQIDEQFLERYFVILLQNPWFMATVFLIIGIIAPFIEESLKPLAIWVLRKRSLSPAQGFVLGLYFGAAFAMIENAGMIIQLGSEGLIESILLRASTALLHITCSGLVGCGYACSMQPGKNNAFIKPLLFAFLFHGLWNSFAVLFSFASLASQLKITWLFPSSCETVSTIAMILEWIVIIFFLWKKNALLKKGLFEQNA